ncbi:MAG: AAA family ATPase, partial [Alphaproteobacteria bacterium]|nr:AAA family ATPase [Alphaproteobacteria bacterium]
MITKLRLKNWKSFKDSTLYIDPLTILIGINASGKSNVLDALDFLKKISTPNWSINDAAGSIRGGFDFIIKRGEKKCQLEVTVNDNDKETVTKINFPNEKTWYKGQIAKELQKIIIFNPVPEKMRGYSPVSSELKPDGSNIAGVIASLPQDETEKLEAELTKYASPLPEK